MDSQAIDYCAAVSNIRYYLNCYIIDNNIKSLVLGVSGGIDSAVVAALASPVARERKIPLIGYSLPSSTNNIDEISRANDIIANFCDLNDFYMINKAFDSAIKELNTITKETVTLTEKEKKISEGNIKARLRMMILYHVAGRNKGMVLSTDNLTEYYLGFWTLHGDVGDYGMIQNLWKTEVYELAKYLLTTTETLNATNALNSCIHAIPTDGLGITDSDLAQILPDWKGSHIDGYAAVDDIIKQYLKFHSPTNNPVCARIIASEYKRNNPTNILREHIY